MRLKIVTIKGSLGLTLNGLMISPLFVLLRIIIHISWPTVIQYMTQLGFSFVGIFVN